MDRKKPDPAIIPLATRMFSEGIRIGELCKHAGISPSTWSRWAAGGVPDLSKLRALEAALDEIVGVEA
jgi:transcriptional regulator with XRE-family HTH domain